MKKWVFYVLTVGMILSLGCVAFYADKEYETRNYSETSTPYNTVEIETFNGTVNSAVTSEDSIKVTLKLWATGISSVDAAEHINDINVSITRDSVSGIYRIKADVDPEFIHPRNYGCDVTLNLPESLYVDLKTSNGKISADGHLQNLKLETSNGEIIISNTAGSADLSTSNGAITVNRHSGDIEGKTSNGDIDADVIMPVRDGICRFASSNGKITLAIPDSVETKIWLETSNGKITVSDFDLGDYNQDPDIFESAMGDGSGDLKLTTSNGNVDLKKLD